MVLAFWSLCCIRVILGCNLRRGFVSKVRGNGENQESKVPPPQGHRGLLVPVDSWNHPSPAEQICFQEQLSQRRDIPQLSQQVWAALSTLHTPLCGSAAQLRLRGEGIQPGSVGSGVQTPNHGQGWSPNRPEEFITSSRNTEPPTQLLPFSPAAWTPFPGEILDSQTAAQEDPKGLGGSSLCISPKGATEQAGRSFKDIPKPKYLKC